jgi:hypothetical protein
MGEKKERAFTSLPGRSLTILMGSTRNGCARAMRNTRPKMPSEWKYSPPAAPRDPPEALFPPFLPLPLPLPLLLGNCVHGGRQERHETGWWDGGGVSVREYRVCHEHEEGGARACMCGVRYLVGGLGRVEIAVEHRVRGVVRRGGGGGGLVVVLIGTRGAGAGGGGWVRGRVGGEDRGAVLVTAGGKGKE